MTTMCCPDGFNAEPLEGTTDASPHSRSCGCWRFGGALVLKALAQKIRILKDMGEGEKETLTVYIPLSPLPSISPARRTHRPHRASLPSFPALSPSK